MVIGNGRLLSDGSMDDLRNQVSRERRLIVDLARPDESIEDERVTIIERSGPRVTMAFDPSAISPAEFIQRPRCTSHMRLIPSLRCRLVESMITNTLCPGTT